MVFSSEIPTDKLPNVVLGRDRGFPRAEAIAQLAGSERPDREALLTQVLENTYEPRRYRAVAAIALGRIASPEAESILLRNLSKTSDDAFSIVVHALGRIAGVALLEAIENLKLPLAHPGGDAVAFATTLIAHRLGLPGRELPFPSDEDMLERPAKEIRLIEFAPADQATAQAVLEGLRRHPYRIKVDPATMTRARCGGQTNVVCPNREFLGAAIERLTERKAVLALVALQSPETSEYSVSYIVLSRPFGAGRVGLTIHRSSGKLVLAGTANVTGDWLEFELRAVRRPGARAVSLKGTITDGRVQTSEALSGRMPQMRRVPARRIQ